MEINPTTKTSNQNNKNNLLMIGGISILAGFGLSYLLQNKKHENNKHHPQKKSALKKQQSAPKSPRSSKQQGTKSLPLKLRSKNSEVNDLVDELKFLDEYTCEIEKIPHLASILEMTDFPKIVSPLLGDNKTTSNQGQEGHLPEESFVCQNSYVLSTTNFGPKNPLTTAKKYLRAGPRKQIFFEPEEVRACIVTTGGLCPGLNVVIREVVNCLYFNYKVQTVFGIRYGHKGFYNYEWETLTPEKVSNIHHLGGSILGSSRGGFELDKIMENIIQNGVNQIYCIGGDGTHKSIYEIFNEISRRKLRIAIVGVPKTIDNDIPIIDKSFGFESAVEEATRAIKSADVEANAAEYGIGLVKLMGRHAGFIAMYAALANRDVNICLVPEFPFEIGGPRGLFEFIVRRLKFKKKCVIVVAEGVANSILDAKLDDVGENASGQVLFADVGVFLKEKIVEYCQAKGINVTLKYIDPTYMIRSIPANALDKQICSQLAQNAVHGAMSGWTGFTIANVSDKTCYVPVEEVISTKRQIEPNDKTWQRLLASTGQPSFLNDDSNEQIADLEKSHGHKEHEKI